MLADVYTLSRRHEVSEDRVEGWGLEAESQALKEGFRNDYRLRKQVERSKGREFKAGHGSGVVGKKKRHHFFPGQ